MRSIELAGRNVREVGRDPLSLGMAVALPVALLLVLQSFGGDDVDILSPTQVTPGIVLFGFVMLMFSSAMVLARDRETMLLDRFLTTPLRPADFVAGYSLPYLAVGVAQAAVLFVLGGILGMEVAGSFGLVAVVLFAMLVLYVALGMIFGALMTVAQTSGAYAAVFLLTVFGGAWFDLEEVGGVFETVGDLLPFKHALDASRAVLADGAGFGDVAGDLAWVTGYAVAAVVAAVLVFRRRMLED